MTDHTYFHDRRRSRNSGSPAHRYASRGCERTSADTREISRRRVLAGAAAVAGTTLAGCLEDDEVADEPVEPIALDDGQVCDVCGMVIEEHHGPAGQLFYADGGPDGRDGPARFDSVTELVVYHDEQAARDRELRAAFLTDYSSVDYDLVERDGTLYISSHVAADRFADATTLSFVVDSAVQGAMGPDYIPFSDAAEADSFADEHGGTVSEWDDLMDDVA